MVIMDAQKKWEDLRKSARYLENEIDTKLVSFSKMGANVTFAAAESDSDKSPLISTDHVVDSLSDEIDNLLKQLGKVNDEMSEISTTSPALASPAVAHTILRHRDILHDYSQEFKKTQNNLRCRREREELLQGVRSEIDSSKNALSRRMDMYLKENEHLTSSDRMVDEQIRIAIETRENLVNQRAAFKKIQSRMNDIASRFPAVSNLIQKINIRKKRDSIIIGIVASICVCFLVYYVLW